MAKADRVGKRKTRDHFQKRTPDLGYYYIVTDTEKTEKNYLDGLKRSLPPQVQARIAIHVTKAKTENLVATCQDQAALAVQYAQRWIVFDRDQVPHFDEIIRQARCADIRVGWSNPCIEIWFDAYFGKMHAYNDSVSCCHRFGETFQEKTGREYKKEDPQLYALLSRFGDERTAIELAESRLQAYLRDGESKPSAMCPCTTLHRMIDEIRRKTDIALSGQA